jgi:DNA-directed RNA polymerase subunit RPC12/RpoP
MPFHGDHFPHVHVWKCVECGKELAMVLDRQWETTCSDREAYLICPLCWVKRKRGELTARLQGAADDLRVLGYDVDAHCDGEVL